MKTAREDLTKKLARALVFEVADPENPGHIRSCPTSDDRAARCSKKCEEIGRMVTEAGDGL